MQITFFSLSFGCWLLILICILLCSHCHVVKAKATSASRLQRQHLNYKKRGGGGGGGSRLLEDSYTNQTWTQSLVEPSSVHYYWTSITSDSSGQYLAAGSEYEGIWLSSNYGSAWTQSSAPDDYYYWISITSDSSGQYLAAVCEYGIWLSSDYGSTWTQSSAPDDNYEWTSITSDSSGQYLAAVLYQGGIWLSSDYGSTWTQSSAPDDNYKWTSITSDSSGQYLAAGSEYEGIWISSCQYSLCGSTCCQLGSASCAAVDDAYTCASCLAVAYTVCPSGFETSTGLCCASKSSQCPSGGGWDNSTGLCSCGINQVTCGSVCCAAGSEYCESITASVCSSCSTSSTSSICHLGYDPDTDQCCAYNQNDCQTGSSYENYTGLCSICPSDEFQCSNGVTTTCCSATSDSNYEYCNTATATCAACSSVPSTFCPTGYASTSSDACCASSTGDCPAGTSLESTSQLCSASQQCLSDSDCVNITFYCEYGSCLQCINQATCEVGEYCDYDSQCQSCSYPHVYPGHYTSAADSTVSQSEASSCLGIFLDVPTRIILIMTVVVVVGIIVAVGSSVDISTTNTQVLLALYYLTGIPTLDVLTDSLYLLTNIFYYKEIFVLVSLIIFLSAALFLHNLYDLSAHPKWYILTPPSSVYPIDVSSHLATIEGSSLVRYCLTTLLSYSRICFDVVRLSPWLLANVGLLLPLFAIGTFLYSTKLLTLRGPRLWFFRLWIGTTDNFCSKEKGPFNFYAYNTSYYTIIKYQTIPQAILLLVNQILVNEWTLTAVVSISVSLFMLVNSVWKFLYLRIVKDLEYSNFPVEVPFLGSLVLQGEELVLVPRLTPPSEPLQPRQPEGLKLQLQLQHMEGLDDDSSVIDDRSGQNSGILLMGQGQGQRQGQLSLSTALTAPIDNPMLVGQVRQKAHTTVEEAEAEMGTETETGSELLRLSRAIAPLLLTVREQSNRIQELERWQREIITEGEDKYLEK